VLDGCAGINIRRSISAVYLQTASGIPATAGTVSVRGDDLAAGGGADADCYYYRALGRQHLACGLRLNAGVYYVYAPLVTSKAYCSSSSNKRDVLLALSWHRVVLFSHLLLQRAFILRAILYGGTP